MEFAVTKRTGVSPVLWLALTALYFASLAAADGEYQAVIERAANEAKNYVTDGRYPPLAVQYVSDAVKAIKVLDPRYAKYTTNVLVVGGEIDYMDPHVHYGFDIWPGMVDLFEVNFRGKNFLVVVFSTGHLDRCAFQEDGFENIYFTANGECGGYSVDYGIGDTQHYKCSMTATHLCRIHWGPDPFIYHGPWDPTPGKR